MCIPNPVFPCEILAQPAGIDRETKTVLCVGRLSYQKNQSVLLKAFALITNAVPDWRLKLVGDGEDKHALERLSHDLSISHKVEFVGAVKDVDSFYKEAHLFCLPSRWEGFPNALAEAMIRGLPCVGFEGCAGVSHLINDETGRLAKGNGNELTLSKALLEMMADDELRVDLGNGSSQYMSTFTPKSIFDRLESELTMVSKAR